MRYCLFENIEGDDISINDYKLLFEIFWIVFLSKIYNQFYQDINKQNKDKTNILHKNIFINI